MRRSWFRLAVAVRRRGGDRPGRGNGGGAPEGRPLVIGHRGAPGYLPDHTLEGYALAIKLGADYVEPDLVATKDGVPDRPPRAEHDRHDRRREPAGVREPPAHRDRRRLPGGGLLRVRLHARGDQARCARSSRSPSARSAFNGKFEIPTLEEVIDLVERESSASGTARSAIYPETKHPTYHQQLGLPLEGRLVAALKRAGLDRKHAPVFIQSFEQSNLQAAQPA